MTRIGPEGAIFLNCDGKKLYFKTKGGNRVLVPVNKYHSPYCLLLCDSNTVPGKYRDTTDMKISQIEEKVRESKERPSNNDRDGHSSEISDGDIKESPYRYILTDEKGSMKFTNPRVYRSFHNPNIRYRTIEVHTTKSWKVPDVSTELFRDFGWPTAEFDIPYRERAMIDLQSEDRLWIFDTGGDIRELIILAYDIETTQFEEGKEEGSIPVDVIGWSLFKMLYKAKRDPDTGRCEFEVVSMPDWMEPKITQFVARSLDEEVENIMRFLKLVKESDIVAGHNLAQFDNKQLWDRVRWLMNKGLIPDDYADVVRPFTDTNSDDNWARPSNVFFYGDMQKTVDFYPLTFDTLFAAKRIFFFLSEYTLKSLAKTFGYVIPERVYLDAQNIRMETEEQEKRTLTYNEHDVREQIGVTLHLLPDAMRLCHLTGMSFSDAMPAGTTKIWDFMTHIRSHKKRKIMPAIAPVMTVCRELFHRWGTCNPKTKKPYTKEELSDLARGTLHSTNPLNARVLKVLKYGTEAPDYVQYPHLVYSPYDKDTLHVITNYKHLCKECSKQADLKHCKCSFCETLKRRFPEGLDGKDQQCQFIVEELKKAGHPESDERLMAGVLADKGWRNTNKGYHFPGGLTLHPSEVKSEFKMWWDIVIADVGAMYPSNLRAENIGGDTVRFADCRHYCMDGSNIVPRPTSPYRFANEKYTWVWMKRVKYDILKNFFVFVRAEDLRSKPEYKELFQDYSFVDYGYLVGIVIDGETGGVSEAMAAVLDVTADLKKRKADSNRPDSGVSDIVKTQIANAYQSMKGLRNSGSVDGERPILLMNHGMYSPLKIKDFYDLFDVVSIKKPINGIEFEIKNIERFGWEGITVSDDGKVEVKPIINVIRHKYDQGMVEITTNGGHSIITPNHSVYDINGDKIIHVSPVVCGKSVNIHRLPNIESACSSINILDYIEDNDKRFFVYIDLSLPWKKKTLKLLNTGRYRKGLDYRVYPYYQNYIKWRPCDIRSRIKYLSDSELRMLKVGTNGRKNSTIPVVIDVTKDLADLVGFYLAEGWMSKRINKTVPNKYGLGYSKQWFICNSDSEMIDHYSELVKNIFGLDCYRLTRIDKRFPERKPMTSMASYSVALSFFFGEVLKTGHRASDKRVPLIFYNSPSDIKSSLIDGVVKGDGSLVKRRSSPPIFLDRTYKSSIFDAPYFSINSVSRGLIYDLRIVMLQLGIPSTIYYDTRKCRTYSLHNLVIDRPRKSIELNDCFSMPVKYRREVKPSGDFVYDLEMKDNHNFVDVSGLLLENTHGILTAPTVSCRQFNLAGGCRITTLGQCVLDDTMKVLDSIKARKVYSDTDGIYLATSSDARTVCDRKKNKFPMKDIFGLCGEGNHFTDPDVVKQGIHYINKRWQTKLNYPEYELEIEDHDGMLFVAHKNYLIFDHKDKDGKYSPKFTSKGNNFKAKDKAPIAMSILEKISLDVAKKHSIWDNEDREFESLRTDIKIIARAIIDGLDMSQVKREHLIFRQNIGPVGSYKTQDKACSKCSGKGCPYCAETGNKLNVNAARSNAIERMFGVRIRSTMTLQCFVANNPLPFIDSPTKSNTKPLAFMWPVDVLDTEKGVEESGGIDLDWYRNMAFQYIRGAFGFKEWTLKPYFCTMKQMTLDGGFTIRFAPGEQYEKKGSSATGKTLQCPKDIFDALKSGQPISDDVMERIRNIDPDALMATEQQMDDIVEDEGESDVEND